MVDNWVLVHQQVSPLAQTYWGSSARGPVEFLTKEEVTEEELVGAARPIIEEQFAILYASLWKPQGREKSSRWYAELALVPLYAGDITAQLAALHGRLETEGPIYRATKTWFWDLPGEVLELVQGLIALGVMLLMMLLIVPMMGLFQKEERKELTYGK